MKDEKACFYGFKCVAVGYEFNPGLDEVRCFCIKEVISSSGLFGAVACGGNKVFGPERKPKTTAGCSNGFLCVFQGIIQLEKELAYLGSVCAAALMKKDLALPIGEETLTEE